ncbi:hypothetical protein VTJ04DRAFT_3296 [Mycothermus thermophilus]|uniref:uncharacterized protein n=1 Tax=Humicola insolens TaxID=85995 RepID=UPI003743D763
MKFSVAAVLAFAAAALAKPFITNTSFNIEEGKPFTLTWEGAQGAVTIEVLTGSSDNLKVVTTVGTAEGTSFTWTPDNLPSGTYAFRITDESGEANYSMMWSYQGTGELTTSSSATLTTLTTRASTSTTASSSTETETTEASSTTTEASTTTSPSVSVTTVVQTTTQAPKSTDAPTNLNDENSGARFMSPLALVLGAVAAVALFN